jgi:hypothetical protein
MQLLYVNTVSSCPKKDNIRTKGMSTSGICRCPLSNFGAERVRIIEVKTHAFTEGTWRTVGFVVISLACAHTRPVEHSAGLPAGGDLSGS